MLVIIIAILIGAAATRAADVIGDVWEAYSEEHENAALLDGLLSEEPGEE